MRAALRAGSRIPLACASGFHGAGVSSKPTVHPSPQRKQGISTQYKYPLLADAVPREYPVDEIGAKFDTSHVADRRYRLMQQTGHDRFVASSAAAG